MYKDILELRADEMDDAMNFMYKPVGDHRPDPDGENWTWQVNVFRKEAWGDAMFYLRNQDTFDYIDEKILSEDVNLILVFLEGEMYELYQLLANGTWQYTNLNYHTIKIGTPKEIRQVRSLIGIPIGGWV